MSPTDSAAHESNSTPRRARIIQGIWVIIYLVALSVVLLLLHRHYGALAVGKILLFITISGVIGWGTNKGALWMLFHPRLEKGHRLWWPHIPMGLVLKNKPKIAESVAKIAKEKFLAENVIRKHVPEEKLKSVLRPMVSSLMKQALGDRSESFAGFMEKCGGLVGEEFSPDKVARKMSVVALEALRARIGSDGFRGDVELVVRRRVRMFCSRPLREYVSVADRRRLVEGTVERFGRAVADVRLGASLLGYCRDAVEGWTEDGLDGAKKMLGEKIVDRLPEWIESGAGSITKHLAEPSVAVPIKTALVLCVRKEAEEYLSSVPLLGKIVDVDQKIRRLIDDNWKRWLDDLSRGIITRKRELAASLLPHIRKRLSAPWLDDLSVRDRDGIVHALRDAVLAELGKKLNSDVPASVLSSFFDAWCGKCLADISPEIENRIVLFACNEVMLLAEAACLRESALYPRLDHFVRDEMEAILTGVELKSPVSMISDAEMNRACTAIADRIVTLAYDNIDNMLSEFELDKMVERVIVDYSDTEIEREVTSTAASEMRGIELVGLVAGALIGGVMQTVMTIMGW